MLSNHPAIVRLEMVVWVKDILVFHLQVVGGWITLGLHETFTARLHSYNVATKVVLEYKKVARVEGNATHVQPVSQTYKDYVALRCALQFGTIIARKPNEI